MSFTQKIDVLELLIGLLHDHENSLDSLVEKLEIIENTVKYSPINNRSLDYEGTLLEDKQYKTILVVDDDRELAKTFKYILDEAGFLAEIAYTGIDAINQVNRRGFDLVILDINLPDMLGNEVAEKLKDIRMDTEYMYITGYQSLKDTILDESESQVLIKPIEPEKLIEIMTRQLKPNTSTS